MRFSSKYKLRYITTALLFLLCGFVLPAQQFRLSLDRDTICFNETVTLTLTGESRDTRYVSEITPPDGLEIIASSKSSSFNSNNGKFIFSQILTLQPYKIGIFTLGPAHIQVGSKRVFSNTVTLVVKSGTPESKKDEIFLRCDLNKKKAVIGEEIILSVRIYSRVNATPGAEWPQSKSFNGFWSYEVPAENTFHDSSAVINGLRYSVITIYKKYIFPNITGKLVVPAFTYSCIVKQNPFPTGDPFVDDMMGIPTEIQLSSPEVNIEVFPTPETNKPKDFSGDVGKFSLGAILDKNELKVNEVAKLTVTINGQGNVKFIQLPPLQFPQEFESFPPNSNDTITVTDSGIEGEKTFVISLIPKKEGTYTLPEISFSYYDVHKKEYVTLHTSTFKIKVLPGDPTTDVAENNLPESFLDAKSGIKTIYLVISGIICLGLLAFFLVFRKKKRKNSQQENGTDLVNPAPSETFNQANQKPDIESMLAKAEHFFASGNTLTGISQLHNSLLTAICNKTEVAREDASIHQLKYRLALKKYSPEFVQEVISFLENLSELRYSGTELNSSQLSEKIQITRKLALLLQ